MEIIFLIVTSLALVLSVASFIVLIVGFLTKEKDDQRIFIVVFVLSVLILAMPQILLDVQYNKIAKEQIEVYPLVGKDSTVTSYQIIDNR